MRVLPDSFDPAVVAAIDARLDEIVAEHGVAVPWAIESGSRAWGFESPDSDYDCRFFFVRPRAAYLDPWPARDVIETPLDGLLDVNGWDLVKAVKLAAAGNAVVGEWLRSPWIYRGEPDFAADLLALAGAVSDRGRVQRHYLHVARDQWTGAATGAGELKLKRVFYSIRPALTLLWLDDHVGIPPMNIDELLASVEVSNDVRAEIDELRAAKAVTRELGTAPVPRAVGAWIDVVLARVDDTLTEPSATQRAEAADGFRALLERWAPA